MVESPLAGIVITGLAANTAGQPPSALRPLRILHVIDSAGLYGAEMVLLDLCTELRRLGQEPSIASIGAGAGEKPLERAARDRDLDVRPLRMTPGPNPWGALRLLQLARTQHVDVVHTHGYKGNILLGFLPRGWKVAPIVATVHGYTHVSWYDRQAVYQLLDRLALRRLDRVVLVHRGMAPRFRDALGKPDWRVIENGLPSERGAAASGVDEEVQRACEGRFPIIGAIGRLSAEKGFDILIRAAATVLKRHDRGLLVILGEGPQRTALETLATSLGMADRLLMPGYKPLARAYCHLFTVFALPSLTEGLPITLLEAMHAGVPIVATSVGGVPDVLAHGGRGLVVPAGDTAALADAIERCVEDEALSSRLAKAAKAGVSAYSSAAMAARYLDLYREIVPG